MVNAPAQLATATALGVSPSIAQGLGATAGVATAIGAAGLPGTSVTSSSFPGKSLGIKVELNLAGTWTDISAYVYQRNPVVISSMGRADWTSTIQPAQLTLTVNNRDGRFTPKNTGGAYYPNITRNTPIRVFLTVTSTTNVSYAGYRFYGEVTEWPLQWDPSGRDVTVDIVAAGIWRRLSQLATPLGSAFRRFNVNSAGQTGLRSYWPMEDGTGSGQLVPYGSVAGTPNAVQQFVAGQAGLSLASAGVFRGSDDIPVFNGATVTATVPAGGTATNNVTRFLLSVPSGGDSASGTTNWNLIEIDTAGTVAKFEVYLAPNGTLIMNLRNSGGAVIAAGTTTTNTKGIPYLVSCELTPSGGDVSFAVRLIAQGAAGITESMTGTITGASVGAVSRVIFNRSYSLVDTAAGHLAVCYGSPTSMVSAAYALNGYLGEFAVDRFKRICGEVGIVSASIGSSSAPMGPQVDDTLANVLQQIEDTDCGLLYELRDTFGLGYRTSASMANQQVAVTFNYAAQVIDKSLTPVYDDALTRNNVTITNYTGYAVQAILTTGPMSVLNPPSGIGNGYAYTRNVSAANDNQVAGIANFLLNLGSVDEVRFPVVTIKMVRSTSAQYFSSIPNLDIGDYFQITNPPSFLLATGPIRQLVWGYTETLNAKQWEFAFNAVPETAWETGFSPGTIQTAQIPGGNPVSSQASGTSGLASLIANGSVTPAMLNSGITIHTIGGNAVTISVNAPPNPNRNDIWIASATGLISQWDGSVWQPFKFDGTATIQAGTIISSLIAAGTIVGSNIAAGTITAGLLAAGIVVAGIVDATTITGALIQTASSAPQMQMDGSRNALFVYDSGTALISSLASASGTDFFSHPYPKGLLSQQLTLQNQSSAPASFSGASVFYSSVAGRPRYLNSVGNDSVLERGAVNVSQFTVGNTTTFGQIGADLNYLADEGNQSSEFEIEVRGNGVGNTTSPQTLTFQLYVDGSLFGGGGTVGATFFSSGAPGLPNFRYTYNVTLSIITTGAGGTATATAWGIVSNSGNVQAGASSSSPGLNGITIGGAFDTTTAHTLELRAAWGATATGQTLTTYRTKIGRRM